jgi:RNA polymerase sigma factor (sigma-70 family)
MHFIVPENDVELWEKCIAGNKDAWEQLVDKYKKLVCKTILETLEKYSSPPGIDWKDIFQDVFVKLLEKLHQWQREAALATYIRAIAFRTTIDHLRKPRHVPLEKDERTDNPDPIPGIFVKELLEYLSPKERLLVKVFFIEEWKPDEIAQFLKKDIGTVYAMKSRLLDKLRKICQKHGLL